MTTKPVVTQLDLDLAQIRKDEAQARRAALDAEERLTRERRIERADRRTFVGYVLVGIAVVTVVLGIIAAIWHSSVNGDARGVERERAKAEQIRACLDLPDAAERQLCVALLDAEPPERSE